MMMLMITMMYSTMAMWKIKSNKNMVMNFCLFTITTTILMSMTNKMTIIPFIIILTILGGLMVLFMYMTASITQINTSNKQMMNINIMMIMPLIIMPTNQILKMKIKINQMETKDSSSEMFNKDNSFPMMIMMMVIMMSMIFIIITCSKVSKPIRQQYTWKL